MGDKNCNNEKANYKITNQSGLYYEPDMIRIIDDPISDRIFSRVVDWILRIAIGIDVAVFLIRDNSFHLISSLLIILGIIIWSINSIIYKRIDIMVSLRNSENDVMERAKKERKIFVICRIITLVLSISSVVLSFLAI